MVIISPFCVVVNTEGDVNLLSRSVSLCNSMDCSPPGSSVRGVLQARMLESIAISFSRDLPNPGIEPGLLWLLYCRQILHHLSQGSLT